MIPGGSMITKRVRKREPKTAASNTVWPCGRRAGRDSGRGTRPGAAQYTAPDGAARGARYDGHVVRVGQACPPVPGTGKAPDARRTISP
ncbi:hypothetical protein GCM10011583_69000 [Streptomyces camponoticapitis]|uniref:Uncharacterized protein n=1 Tax=Streptomyces camponoticapitis TaxID=1616125 RepID=A0ABQ2EUN6_9ACTN|nr:hypothetical protein GCM10011583_69000 [Streptomyces camponoticapitis]